MGEPTYPIHRHDSRIRVNLPVILRFGWRGREELKASIIDISERGLGVRSSAPLRFGLEVEVKIEGTPEEAKHYQVAWVRNAEPPHHGVEMGLELKQ